MLEAAERSDRSRTLSGRDYQEPVHAARPGREHYLSSAAFTSTTQGRTPAALAYDREDVLLLAKRRVHQLLTLYRPGWDSYSAMPVDEEAVDRASRFVQKLTEHELPVGLLFPLADGGIRMEWRGERYEVLIDVYSTGYPTAYFADEDDGTEWEGELPDAPVDLISVLRELASERAAGQ